MRKNHLTLLLDPALCENPGLRRYSLTHTDATGARFLMIGADYDYAHITPLHDEVLGTWTRDGPQWVFQAVCRLDSPVSKYSIEKRLEIFKRHIASALMFMLSPDRAFIEAAELTGAGVMVCYHGGQFSLVEDAGLVSDYLQDGFTISQASGPAYTR